MEFLMHLIRQTISTQMLITKARKLIAFIMLLTVSTTCLSNAAPRFEDYFQINPGLNIKIANKITSHYLDNKPLSTQHKDELEQLDNSLNKLLSKHTKNPAYWFLKGLNHRNLAAYYHSKKQFKLADEQIQKKNTAYQKAIELDKAELKKLSASIYSTMKFGLPEDLKIQATQQELKLGGSADSESAYWYLHWSNIDQLKKAGRDKEAEQAYRNMQKEMKEQNANMSVYSALNQTIEQTTFNKPTTDKKPETSKAEPPPSKPEHSQKPDKPLDRKMLIITSIVALSLISLISLMIYELKIKRKRK